MSLAVTAVLILGVLATFDFSSRMNRVQMNVADMQQSLRIAQNEVVKLSRMTGRGSLPVNTAIQVTNNVAAGTKLVPTEATTLIDEGTDVLRLRGAFTSALYQIEFMNSAMWTAPDADGNGSVVVRPLAAGVPQDLPALLAAAKEDESLLLVSPFDTYAVAKSMTPPWTAQTCESISSGIPTKPLWPARCLPECRRSLTSEFWRSTRSTSGKLRRRHVAEPDKSPHGARVEPALRG